MDSPRAEALLTLVEEASAASRGADAKAALDRSEDTLDELRSALDWYVDEGRTDEALRLVNALYRFWITKQRFEDGAVWFDRALASPNGDDRLRGQAFTNAGFMPFWMGQDDRAAELFQQGLEPTPRS